MAQATEARRARWRVLLNTVIVMLGTLLSRVLGLAREAIFSRRFGTAPEFGAFSATFTILDILYLVVIGGALGSALIPVFSRLLQERQEARAWELANTVLTLALLAFTALAGLVALAARPLLALTVARGYAADPALLDLAVALLRLMLLQPLLLGLGGLTMAILQSFDRFTLPAIAFNIYNLAIIAAALLVAPVADTRRDAVRVVAVGVVVGAFLYLLVQVPGVLQVGWRVRPALNWRLPEVRRVGHLLAPRLLGQSALQINIIVMTALIGLLSASAQAANRYAYQLLMLPHGLLAVSLGTVMFPRLARLWAANDLQGLRHNAITALRLVLWLTVPAAVALALLHVPIVRLLFQGGAFDSESLRLTGRALLFYTPGAIGLAGSEIVIRTFYAMEDTRTPVLVGIATIVLNGVLAYSLIRLRPDIGVVALAYSLANVLEFLVLLAILARRLGGLRGLRLRRSLLAAGAATLALGIVLLLSLRLAAPFVPVQYGSAYSGADGLALAGWLVGTALLGGMTYLGVGALLGAPETREIWSLLRRRPA
ncbi:murein biosynthesis integral membrane protein MurJ [Kallotenue papyrolyticum]|uniref:murein biosynthesis integral membrane protein MurJ n=1 Tax=Kallotenue papyrolyticum TaxID=1325125 RepID=UPI000492BC16|nr:murein biosynthesis integral membrane protein MurJ [Kallotenue papyrolyticum]